LLLRVVRVNPVTEHSALKAIPRIKKKQNRPFVMSGPRVGLPSLFSEQHTQAPDDNRIIVVPC
jgi:hypothetical protein